MNRAFCQVRNGDVAEGLTHARKVISGLPPAHRTRGFFIVGRDVLNAIPQADGNRPVVSEYHEWLNSTFGHARSG